MKHILFFIIALSNINHARAQCLFDGMSLGHIEESPEFVVRNLGTVSFPRNLIKSQEKYIGDFQSGECEAAFTADEITQKSTGIVFTAYKSNDDECDGGNSYGVIVKGTAPEPANAIATIEDSDLWCL